MATGSLQQHGSADEQQLPSSSFIQVPSTVTDVNMTPTFPLAPTSTQPPTTTIDNDTNNTSATDGIIDEEEDEDDEYRKIQKVRTTSVNLYYFIYLTLFILP